ncbi:MAG: hypothetical protein EOP54_03595 [Sphingobacteriales bacterium]|nr:MAG: hypothetical protein EOP54_03595 [Sphingobacteriales bacterium]
MQCWWLLLFIAAVTSCNASTSETPATKPTPAQTGAPPAAVTVQEEKFLVFTCKPFDIQLFWKAEDGHIFSNFDSLDRWLSVKRQQQLIFAMNGGMYMEDNSPLGLYIENGKTLRKLNKANGRGNFYMKPNGVFYITNKGTAHIKPREDFNASNVKFATQSGPMVLLDGVINPTLNKGSENVNIRNGVGILPNGDCIFMMSRSLINFYDFALFFKEKGCKYALYLDGAISQTYLPGKFYTYKGRNFGVIIGVTKAL